MVSKLSEANAPPRNSHSREEGRKPPTRSGSSYEWFGFRIFVLRGLSPGGSDWASLGLRGFGLRGFRLCGSGRSIFGLSSDLALWQCIDESGDVWSPKTYVVRRRMEAMSPKTYGVRRQRGVWRYRCLRLEVADVSSTRRRPLDKLSQL